MNTMNTTQAPPSNGCGDATSKTQQYIDNNKKNICNDFKDALGNLRQREGEYKGYKPVFKYKQCFFIKAEETWRFYRGIDVCTSLPAQKDGDLLKDKLGKAGDTNKAIAKALADAAKSIQDAKAKFSLLSEAALKLKNKADDNCNKAQRGALAKLKAGNKDFETCFKTIVDGSQQMYASDGGCSDGDAVSINKVACTVGDVSGIQSFTNIDSILSLHKDLTDALKAFRDDVLANIKTGEDDQKKTYGDLGDAQQQRVTIKETLWTARTLTDGVEDIREFLCNLPCGNLPPIKTICDQAQNNYCSGGNNGGGCND
ncbi:hypothetical protein [Chitinophaga sp. 212800010-3]|uniref:hypothetical protein n=1 Tax=unclassified Chitinophaga TaxID=2619133 RepID=UPI002DE2359B|nr:DUF725 domain-containing protein [Chitinophaga sp. 212800010-3]